MPIRVLVCDDSAVMRGLLSELINAEPDLEVVGTAPDAMIARDMIKRLTPDVLTLDVEMPRMDGLEFLDRLMRLRPMAVVMISAHTERGSETTLKALELGAVDFMVKPGDPQAMIEYGHEVCDKIRAAAQAKLTRKSGPAPRAAGAHARFAAPDHRYAPDRLILIGASTGGTEAIKDVLVGLPAGAPPVMIVQHMPEMFTGSFAKRLDGLCRIHVKEAEHGERLEPGVAYLAPGHSHLMLARRGSTLYCELSRSEPVNRHRPSVDVLFESASALVGGNAVAALLTGMGKDGAQGLLRLRKAGTWTIAQDQDSCVVYGMPREAAAIGAAQEVAPLGMIAERILARLAGAARRA